MGCVHAIEDFVDRAVEGWERAVEIDPGCGEAHYALAWAYYDGGDQERGYEHVNQAVESGVDLDSVKDILELRARLFRNLTAYTSGTHGKTIIGLHTHNYSGFITHNFDY